MTLKELKHHQAVRMEVFLLKPGQTQQARRSCLHTAPMRQKKELNQVGSDSCSLETAENSDP